MRNIKVIFAALVFASASAALADAPAVSHTVSLTNGISDTLAVTGNVTVNIIALNTATTSSAAMLAYSTHADENGGTVGLTSRKVTVVSDVTLPTNVTGKVTFSPENGNGSAASGGVDIGSISAADLVTGIPRFITQSAAALTYSFTATSGFDAKVVTVTYTLVDE